MGPKVLFFIPGLFVGGAEVHTVELRARLTDLGYESHILVHGPRRSPAIVSHRGAKGAIFLDLVGMSDLRGWFKVREFFRALRPDLIVCVNQTPLIVSVLTRMLGGTRAKIVCVFHTTDIQPREQRTFRLFRWALRFADSIIFVSDNQKRIWLERGLTSRTAITIRNGIDIEAYRGFEADRERVRKGFGLLPSDYVLCLLATFRPEKNHLEAVRILMQLKQKGLPAKLLLIGDGPTRPQVLDFCRDNGLLNDVVFAGEQLNIKPYVSASDVGILTSISETFPISALETLALGVPMVSYRVGGVPEIIDDEKNGYLVEPGETGQFVERLVALSSPNARAPMSDAAKQSVQSFGLRNMIDSYDTFFRELTRCPAVTRSSP